MYIIRGLPMLLPLVASVIISISGIYYGIDYKELAWKIVVSIILFYGIGYILSYLTLSFLEHVLVVAEKKVKMLRQMEEEEVYHSVDRHVREKVDNGEFQPYVAKKIQ